MLNSRETVFLLRIRVKNVFSLDIFIFMRGGLLNGVCDCSRVPLGKFLPVKPDQVFEERRSVRRYNCLLTHSASGNKDCVRSAFTFRD